MSYDYWDYCCILLIAFHDHGKLLNLIRFSSALKKNSHHHHYLKAVISFEYCRCLWKKKFLLDSKYVGYLECLSSWVLELIAWELLSNCTGEDDHGSEVCLLSCFVQLSCYGLLCSMLDLDCLLIWMFCIWKLIFRFGMFQLRLEVLL